MPKGKGSRFLRKIGGIEKFNFDLVFPGCLTGKTGAVYHDDIDEVRIVGHHKVHLTRNVTIVEVDYYMKFESTYREMLDSVKEYLDKIRYTDYNKKW